MTPTEARNAALEEAAQCAEKQPSMLLSNGMFLSERIAKAIRALISAPAPVGEKDAPTKDMILAGIEASHNGDRERRTSEAFVKAIYVAMRKAAPAPTADDVVGDEVREALERVQLWASQLDPADPLSVDLDMVLEAAAIAAMQDGK